MTPYLSKALLDKTLDQARDQINAAFGILPGLNNTAVTGPAIRKIQRNLCQFHLQPIAEQMAEEASDKLGNAVTMDVMRPLQAWDSGRRARTVTALVKALAEAKAAGVDGADVDKALTIVNWGSNDGAA